jgi:hypothetical protein
MISIRSFRLKAEATLTLMRICSLPPEGGSHADADEKSLPSS